MEESLEKVELNTRPADTHHAFSPSRLQRYSVCSGAYTLEQGVQEEPSEAAEEGTKLHAAVATGDLSGLDGEQTEAVTACLDYLAGMKGEGAAEVYTELPVDIHGADGELLTCGTCDVVIVRPDGKLIVVDWKFGRNPVEDVAKNLQLAAYAAGAMQKFGVTECECHVFQPRIHRTSGYTFTKLEAIVENIRRVIERCEEERLVLNPSDQCQYCRGRGRCPAFQRRFAAVARREAVLPDDPAILSDLYEKSKLVEKFCKDIKAAVEREIQEHGRCGKYVWKNKVGNRVIDDISATYSAIQELVGQTEFLRQCRVSVPSVIDLVAEKLAQQAECDGQKMTKKEAREKAELMLSQYIRREETTHTIVEG